MTPRQLWRDIEREVAEQGGRRSIFGLANFLGVESVHVDRQIQRNCITFTSTSSFQGAAQTSSSAPSSAENSTQNFGSLPSASLFFLSESNELLDESYDDTLIRSLNEWLEARGIANLNDFASKQSLPHKFIDRLLTKCFSRGLLLECEYDEANNILVRPDFRDKFTKILRSALCACTRPVSVQKLIQQRSDLYSTPLLVQYAIDTISKDVIAMGNFSSKSKENVVFTPNVFLEARSTWVSNALNKDMHISIKTLEKLGYTVGGKEPIFSENIILPHSVVPRTLIDKIETSIAEASQEKNILAFVPPLIPEELQESDLKVLLSKIEFSALGRIYGDLYFVPNAIKERCLQLFQQEQDEISRARAEKQEEESQIISASKPTQQEPSKTYSHATIFESIKKWCPAQRRYEVALSFLAEDLLPQVLAMKGAQAPLAPLSTDSQWKKKEWLQTFEPTFLNLAFFLRSIENLPSPVSPDQRVVLASHALETLNPTLVQKLCEACQAKFLLPALGEDDFTAFAKLLPPELSKPMIQLHDLPKSNQQATSVKKFTKIVDLCLEPIGVKPGEIIFEASTFSEILATHVESAKSQLTSSDSLEPSTRMRLALSLLHAKLANAMLLTTAKHINFLINLVKTELKAIEKPLFNDIANQNVIILAEAAYNAMLNTIRAKQTKQSEKIQTALAAFDIEFESLSKRLI